MIVIIMIFAVSASANASSDRCHVAWSHYTGWEPWQYIQDSGIAQKWAEKYSVDLQINLINDYVESINQYTAGSYDAVAVTNMDALTIPAAGGVDSTFIVLGDFSNGNDAIVMKINEDVTIADLRGREVMLVELSVSHYLLARALEMNGMSERDVFISNTSDADISGLFLSVPEAVVVTWNPIVMTVMEDLNSVKLFDSSEIPGEIIDGLLVKTDASDSCKRVLTGAWYEAMDVMNS